MAAGSGRSLGAASQRKRFSIKAKRRSLGKYCMSARGTRASWTQAAMVSRSAASRARSFRGSAMSALEALDLGPAGSELFRQALVTPVQVVDAIEDGVAFRHETGQHQGDRGPKVGRHDRGA